MLPTLAVADLHGHRSHLDALLRWAGRTLGEHRLVLLGDFVDNGPDVPGLLDRLLDLQQQLGDRFVAVLGNHDLACLRALEDERWWQQWSRRYWNPRGGTPGQYGCSSRAQFVRTFPARHRALLQALPWAHLDEQHLYVHAGLQPGSLVPQLAALQARRLPAEPLHLPPPLRDRTLATVSDPGWERTVVSAHSSHLDRPLFRAPRRRCLRAEVDRTGHLHALVLPDGPLVTVTPSLHVHPQEQP